MLIRMHGSTTVQLICAFCSIAYAKSRFSHDAANHSHHQNAADCSKLQNAITQPLMEFL